MIYDLSFTYDKSFAVQADFCNFWKVELIPLSWRGILHDLLPSGEKARNSKWKPLWVRDSSEWKWMESGEEYTRFLLLSDTGLHNLNVMQHKNESLTQEKKHLVLKIWDKAAELQLTSLHQHPASPSHTHQTRENPERPSPRLLSKSGNLAVAPEEITTNC